MKSWIKYVMLYSSVFILMLVLGACGQKENEQKINQYFSDVLDAEQVFEEQGTALTELESEETSIYDDLIALEEVDQDNQHDLIEEGSSLVTERASVLDKEKEALTASKKAFEKIKSNVNKVKDEDEQEKLEAMVEAMQKRYQAYEDVYDNYTQSLHLTTEFYDEFQDESTDPEELYHQTEKINDSYQAIRDSNDVFNDYTATFNQQKEAYVSFMENQ